jgi:hypothetical protein
VLQQLIQTAGARSGDRVLEAGLQPQEFDPQSILREEDPILEAQQRARASLRQARGRIPQRALSTSIVQIAENLFGGVEKPLARIAAAEQEFSQLGTIGREITSTRGKRVGLEADRTLAERAIKSGSFDPTSTEGKKLTASVNEFTKAIDANIEKEKVLEEAQDKQVKRVDELARSAVGAGDILRNLGAGFIGGIGGALVTQAVSAAATVALQAATLVSPTLDRALGSGLVSQRIQQEQAAAFAQSGFSRSALRGGFGDQGFGVAQSQRFMDVIGAQAEAIAGAQQAQQRIDTERAATALERQRREQGLPEGTAPGLFRGTGANLSFASGGPGDFGVATGLFEALTGNRLDSIDIGGSDPAAKVLARSINDLQAGRGPERFKTYGPLEALDEFINGPSRQIGAGNEDLATLNKRIQASGAQFVPGTIEEGGTLDELLRSTPGTADLQNALKRKGLTISGAGDQQTLIDLVEQSTAPTRDFGTQAAARGGSVGFQNQMWQFFRQRERSLRGQQFGFGLQGAQAPLLPGGTGIPGGGGEAFRARFGELAGDIREVEAAGMAMIEGITPGKVLTEFQALGKELETLGKSAGRIQATQSMRAYELSVKQASFAVEDLTALTEKGAGSSIGRMERENMLMQRRLQTLQFEQQQRSINFGVAVAGFQTEGATGAERGARLRVAKEEASIQQEMLNLSKGIFGNQVQIVDQRNLRQLTLATDNLENIVKSFQENNRLKEIGQMTTAVTRRQKQLEVEISNNLQTELQLEEMRDAFISDLATYSEELVTAGDNYDRGAKIFRESVTNVTAQIDQLQSLVKGKGVAGLTVRDITIAPRVNGTIVDYKELVDLIVEELGKQGIRTGNLFGNV